MAVKIQFKRRQFSGGFTSLVIMSMLYNCVLTVSLCYVALIKDWWAALFLIPFCVLAPSSKTEVDDEDDKEENNGE